MTGRATRFRGDFENWEDARVAASGYDSDLILKRTIAATREVAAGRGAFERDSVVFRTADYPFHVITTLLCAALETAGNLTVLDFGGSLGTTYRQCRSFLDPLLSLRWNVVEQTSFAKAGQAEFSTKELRFFESIDDIAELARTYVAIFSSSLQYVEQPYEALRAVLRTSSRYMIIDRTPFSSSQSDRLCIQCVPKHIYRGSYPMWIFSEPRFLDLLENDWDLTADFDSPEGRAKSTSGVRFQFRGYIFKRRMHGDTT